MTTPVRPLFLFTNNNQMREFFAVRPLADLLQLVVAWDRQQKISRLSHAGKIMSAHTTFVIE